MEGGGSTTKREIGQRLISRVNLVRGVYLFLFFFNETKTLELDLTSFFFARSFLTSPKDEFFFSQFRQFSFLRAGNIIERIFFQVDVERRFAERNNGIRTKPGEGNLP